MGASATVTCRARFHPFGRTAEAVQSLEEIRGREPEISRDNNRLPFRDAS